MALAGIILAAGKGTRMKSEVPKVMHEVAGLPMVAHVVRSMKNAGIEKSVVVVGHGAELVRSFLADYPVVFAEQLEQLGTGHAVLMAQSALQTFEGCILVSAGDTPMITDEAFKRLISVHQKSGAKATVATFNAADPTGYGRLVRDAQGKPERIVEHKDASDSERAITEVNAGVYCFDAATLFELLPTVKAGNAQGEYYLTDVIAELAKVPGQVEAAIYEDDVLFMGVNDRWHLAEANALYRERLNKFHALNGVTITDPISTYIEVDVEIGQDTVIEPNCTLIRGTTIGKKCVIGPGSLLDHAVIGDDVRVLMSVVNHAEMRTGSRCGPFAHLRPKSILMEDSGIGNFVEVKNATLGKGTKASHLSYIGDAEVGAESNIGAGTITCNYDGFRKNKTTIGDRVFVGSNSTLVAPITIENDGFVAAGSVITENVSEGALAVGRARQEEKAGWVMRWRERNRK